MKKKSVMRGFAAALVVVSAGGCGKQEQQEQRPEQQQPAQADAAAPSVASTSITGRKWTVCEVDTSEDDHGHNPPPKGGEFEVVETTANSGIYALKLVAGQWEPGWRALVLGEVGTDPAKIPHGDWMAPPCKTGDGSGSQAFEPTADTKRYRGATCLPDGMANHIDATCSGTGRYHEIVVYVHEPAGSDDIPHMLLQYCARGELEQDQNEQNGDNDNLVCKDPTTSLGALDPHPGHVHIDP